MNIKLEMTALILVTCFVVTLGKKCDDVPTCSCLFGADNVPVEKNTTGREAMAGIVGALATLVVTGGGFGAWYLLKGRKMPLGSRYGRSASDISVDSVSESGQGEDNGKSRPPPFRRPRTDDRIRDTGAKPSLPNIYQAGLKDNINSHVGSK